MQNNNHLRISFDIDRLNDYEIENRDKTLKLSFTYPIEARFNELKEQYPNLFAGYSISPDKKNIAIRLHRDTDIKSYREGNTLAIDVSIPEKKPRALMDEKNLETAWLEYQPKDGNARFSFKFESLPPYEIRQENGQTQLILGKPYKFQTATLNAYSKRKDITFKEEASEKYIFSIPATLKNSSEQNDLIIIETEDEQNETKEPEETVSGSPVSSGVPLLKVRSLSFSWNQPVNIAVFKRGKHLWIIFDNAQTLNIAEMSGNISPLAKDLYQLPNPQATILRLTPEPDVKIGIRKEGLLWIVDLYTGGRENPTREIPVFTRYDALNRAYLFAQTGNAGNIVSIFDPEIGDVISVIPLDTTNFGTENDYVYPDLDFLKTINGLAVVYKADDIEIGTGTNGVTFRRNGADVNVSHELNDLKRRSLLYGDDNLDRQFITRLPAEILNKNFNDAVEELEQDIIKANAEDTNKIRMREAGYMLNKGLGTNALKILNALEKENAPESETELFHGMRGLANFLTRRYPEALADFSYGALENNEEAQFWKRLIRSALSPQTEDNDILQSYMYMLKNYPDEIRRRIALIGIKSALLVNDEQSVQNYIDIIRDSSSPVSQAPAVNFYNAQKLELMGYPLNAVREYRNAADSDSAYFSALARRRIIDIRLKTNSISPADAAEEYEKLRYAWGEKNFQISLLEQLADVYIRDKNYAKALQTFEKAQNISSSKEEKERFTKRMVKLFEDIYYNNQDDNLPPLKSLALYQDYNWLAPLSRHYNAIVQKLADRLVAVDLLNRAYNLLETQMNSGRLNINETGTVGTRMALINLFNNEPEKAVEILDKTENDQLAPTIIAHRRIIRAKALAGLGRTDEALELLKNDYSRNGLLLKTEIFWNNKQWGDAADSIKYLIEKPKKGQPLSKEQTQFILEWTTALKKAGRETVIVRIKNTFDPYFKDTPYYSLFNVLTDTLESDKIDIKNIDETINNIADFGNFARIYAEAIQKGGLSETIK